MRLVFCGTRHFAVAYVKAISDRGQYGGGGLSTATGSSARAAERRVPFRVFFLERDGHSGGASGVLSR